MSTELEEATASLQELKKSLAELTREYRGTRLSKAERLPRERDIETMKKRVSAAQELVDYLSPESEIKRKFRALLDWLG